MSDIDMGLSSSSYSREDVRYSNGGEIGAITPSVFINVVSQTLEYTYDSALIEGEVASFKVNQGKWVFFDIKDDESSVPCFMTLWSLRQPLEDGMKVVVRGTPKVTKWGKFSLTVSAVRPVGEGSLKKAYELLKSKLAKEGLFDISRKRKLPKNLVKIGVISSVQAAGYADFVKIINKRWGGMKVLTAHTQVQGLDAPDQIIRALKYFNDNTDVQVIAIIRGGGSADDLSCFNDEALVRAIASSKIPVITGIGHEVDESLCDLAADVRASTPSNVAELLTRDRVAEKAKLERMLQQMLQRLQSECSNLRGALKQRLKILEAMNPEKVLKQGYAIVAGETSLGSVVKITTFDKEMKAEIKMIKERS